MNHLAAEVEIAETIGCHNCRGECCHNIEVALTGKEAAHMAKGGTVMRIVLPPVVFEAPYDQAVGESCRGWRSTATDLRIQAWRETDPARKTYLRKLSRTAWHLRNGEGAFLIPGRCGYQGPNNECTDYENRPRACRDFTEAGEACLSFREDAGIPVTISQRSQTIENEVEIG